MVKKIPMRTCVVTKHKLPKKELLRIVKDNQGKVFVDLSSRANGRGAYIEKSLEAVELAKQNKALERALECKIEDKIYEDIIKAIKGGY